MAKRNKRNEHKHIVENPKHFKHVKKLVGKGVSITKAVENLCNNSNLKYSDNLRRVFSIALAKSGSTDDKKRIPLEQTGEYNEALNRKVKCSKYYLITWAQAETPIHKQFWENIKAYAKHIGAEIIVSAGRYKNPNSIEKSRELESKEKNKSVWSPELREYLHATRIDLNSRVTVLADLKIQPTAVYPINSVNGFTAERTSILPHPKVQARSLPVLRDYPQKLVMTTGAVTVPNYTDTKAGAKGAFEHELGFAIVEVVNDKQFYVRQVQADESGRFYDLNFCANYGQIFDTFKSKEDWGPNFIVWGDVHLSQEDPEAIRLAKTVTKRLGIEEVVLHDLFDGVSVNPHSEKDPFRMLEKEETGEDNLESEVDNMLDWLDETADELGATLHVVAANHNDFLDRFLSNTDWRKSRNKKMYLELSTLKAKGFAEKGMVNTLIDQRFYNTPKANQVLTYAYGDSLRRLGWELGLHFDRGANGARGSIGQFKDLSTKTIGAHGHTLQRVGGAVMTPTLTRLQLDYNKGSLSSWVQGVTLGYANGKVSQIVFINGGFTTLWDEE